MASTHRAPLPVQKHACALCSRRKIKCNKEEPCSNCAKSKSDCIYQSLTPSQGPRKRPAGEELLSRLSEYEDLLRKNNIEFHPYDNKRWIPSPFENKLQEKDLNTAPSSFAVHEKMGRSLSPRIIEKEKQTTVLSVFQSTSDPKNNWLGLSNELQNPPMQRLLAHDNDISQNSGQDGLTKKLSHPESLLLTPIVLIPETFELHPEPRHIFRMWQIFVENINPLIKIIHVPTLQQRIFELVWNLGHIPKPTEAIMFAVYTLAVASLSSSECQQLFGEDKAVLLERYRSGTNRSLMAANFLITRDLEVLQAFVLHLLADRESDSTATLSAVAVRIGQKMGLHHDESTPEISFFEKEMRIRLWWQIRGLDACASQATGGQTIPSDFDDIRMPLNINDSELHPNMAEPPMEHTGTTEMLYCLLKYETPRWLRTSVLNGKSFRATPRELMTSAHPLILKDQAINDLEKLYNDKYLQHCDPRIPIHALAKNVSELAICRMRFMAHHPRNRHVGAKTSLEESEMLFQVSVKILDLDNKCKNTTFAKFLFSHMVFRSQTDAVIYTISELRHHTTGDVVCTAWEQVEVLYYEHPELINDTSNKFYVALGDLTLKAWEARQRELVKDRATRVEDVTPKFIESLILMRQNHAVPASSGAENGFSQPEDPQTALDGNGQLDDPDGEFTMQLGFGADPIDWDCWNELLPY